MGTMLTLEDCEHGSDPYCCVPCANARGVERIGGPGLSITDEMPVSRPITASYDSVCRWPDCNEEIWKGDTIVGIDPHGFVHWHHVSR